MEAIDWDDDASFTCDQESIISAPDQVELRKNVEKLSICDDPMLNQVASMPYRHCRVPIFKKAESDRYFYEPIVLLEQVTLPKKERSDGQMEVTLKIKLWGYDLERRIIRYLRSEIGEVALKAHQVQMMPYKEVRLIAKKNTSSLRVLTEAVCLLHLPVEVTFNLLFFPSEETEFCTKFLIDHLELHFTSPSPQRLQGTAKKLCESAAILHRDSAFNVHRNSVFGINIVGQSIGSREDEEAIAKNFLQDDVLSKIRSMNNFANGSEKIQKLPCEAAFVASTYANVSEAGYVTFAELIFSPKDIYGVFDKDTGLFTAKISGKYLFRFEGVAYSSTSIKMQLILNGLLWNESLFSGCFPAGDPNHDCRTAQNSMRVSLYCIIGIKSGDQVGISIEDGILSSLPKAARFISIFLTEEA